MTKKQTVTNKYLFKSMMRSSILVMLIPLLVGVISLVVLIMAVTRSATMINLSTLNSTVTQTDKTLNNICEATSDLGETSQYRELIFSDEPTNDELLEFQKILRSHTDYYPLVNRTIVFLKNGMVISDSNYRTSMEFFEDDFFLYGIGQAQIESGRTSYHYKNFQLRTADSRGLETPYSLLFQTITVGASPYLSSVVLQIIDNKEILKGIDDVAWSSGHLEIVQDDSSLAVVGKSFSSKQYVQKSQYFDLEFRASGQSLYETEIFTGLIIALSILVCLGFVGAVYLAIAVTRKNYKPISLIDSLATSQSEKSSVSLVEVAQKVREFADKYQNIQSRYNEEKENAISQLFLKMLKGQSLPESRFSMCHRYGIEYENRNYVVIEITSPFISAYVKALPSNESTEIQRLVFESSTRLVDAVFKEFDERFLLDYDKSHYMLVLAFDSSLDLNEQMIKIKNLCLAYRDSVNQQYKLNTSLAISDPISTIKDLNLACRQADDAQSFIELLGSENEVVLYSSIDNSKSTASSKNDERESHLSNLIRAKDFEASKNLFLDILDNDITKVSPSLRPLLLDSIVCKVIKSVMQLSAYSDENEKFDLLLNDIIESDTALLKRNTVIKLLEELDVYYKENFDRSEEACKRIMEFIDERYVDPNLNVGLIADTFNFSLSYISRLFKKSTGQNILDYIQKKRIDKAKELLKNKISIQDAAEQVGYMESRALIRAFKKQEHITPGKYK